MTYPSQLEAHFSPEELAVLDGITGAQVHMELLSELNGFENLYRQPMKEWVTKYLDFENPTQSDKKDEILRVADKYDQLLQGDPQLRSPLHQQLIARRLGGIGKRLSEPTVSGSASKGARPRGEQL